ncbi:hypothetical protein [Chondromyces crocatus]|uniref:Transglutaminase-like domain-containing protein n=1 Tax=Chondromyces crocatus TaxID=52 RepID=A0A0K1EDM2_CHOCO|nr:hypothetical protein [Chondromyces crocatus]AKT38975.1 uncharacterized protein CMC5_031220 [Chondromyces crocatus]
MRRPLALAALASLAIHALGLAGVRPRSRAHTGSATPPDPSHEAQTTTPPAPAARAGIAPLARAHATRLARLERARRARTDLVARARSELTAGRLALGAFLLRASAIDADALGQPLDLAEAEQRYDDRVGALREALRHGTLRDAVTDVFADLRYHGQPGGWMADALLDGGGSCEQLAQLVAASAYDAGARRTIALRFYGGIMADGAAHITPVSLEDVTEHDLMSGKPSAPGGTRLAPEDLVEAYARAHDLAPKLAASPGIAAPGAGDANAASATSLPPTQTPRPTLFAGMPPNQDRYPGALPLYASRAIAPPDDSVEGIPLLGEQARSCAYAVRMAALAPPVIDVATSHGLLAAEPRRQPSPRQLERQASLLSDAEALSRQNDLADRLMAWACLAALGPSTAVDLALAGERRLSTTALERTQRARDAGREALAAVRWDSVEGAQLQQRLSSEYGGRTWLLLFLDGGARVVLDLVDRGHPDDWGMVSALAALILWPPTRTEGLTRAERLPPRAQIDVMHELFHAHDHLRPWASNVALASTALETQRTTNTAGSGAASSDAAETGTDFQRAYRAYRSAAFRLWEAQGGIAEILDTLATAAQREHLDPAWEAALLDYVGRNALGLHSIRSTGMEVVRALKQAVQKNGHPSLDSLRRQLDYIDTQRSLTATTLADASRLH